jgi:hypothetical protein
MSSICSACSELTFYSTGPSSGLLDQYATACEEIAYVKYTLAYAEHQLTKIVKMIKTSIQLLVQYFTAQYVLFIVVLCYFICFDFYIYL